MWHGARECVSGVFYNHAYVPRALPCEVNAWAFPLGMGSYPKVVAQMKRGLTFRTVPFDGTRFQDSMDAGGHKVKRTFPNPYVQHNYQNGYELKTLSDSRAGDFKAWCLALAKGNGTANTFGFDMGTSYIVRGRSFVWDGINSTQLHPMVGRADYEDFLTRGPVASLICGDSSELRFIKDGSVDLVITDPPFGDNVNYSELADFFYVWLSLVLKGQYRSPAGGMSLITRSPIYSRIHQWRRVRDLMKRGTSKRAVP
jgi:hypothetical protein